jgi:hypothetical protein
MRIQRRDEMPAVRVEGSRKLVEDCGITVAEIARQVGVSTSAISKSWDAVIPASQRRPYFSPLLPSQAVRGPTMAPRALRASLGLTSICKPRCPAFTNTLDSIITVSSMTIETHLFCAKGWAADMLAGQPFGVGQAHQLCGFAVECAGQFFHADFPVRRNNDADRLAVDLSHKSFQHASRFDAMASAD